MFFEKMFCFPGMSFLALNLIWYLMSLVSVPHAFFGGASCAHLGLRCLFSVENALSSFSVFCVFDVFVFTLEYLLALSFAMVSYLLYCVLASSH